MATEGNDSIEGGNGNDTLNGGAGNDKFIINATDCFTKWVEVVPLTVTSDKTMSMFILNYIICRYGVPSAIITDNGGQFKNKDLKEICSKFKITQHWSSIYYP